MHWLEELPIGFARPLWLLAFLVVPWMLRMERVGYVAMSRRRARWVRGLRVTIVSAVILALAGLQVTRTSDELAVVFLIDRSDSTRDQLEAVLRDLAIARETMTPRDAAGLIVFGSDAYVESAPAPRPDFEALETSTDPGGTDLSRAIRLGLGVLPEDRQRRLVLVSDGNENLGEALEEAKAAAASNVPIDVLPIDRSVDEEVLIEAVDLPQAINRDEPFEVRVTVRSTVDVPAKLRLFRDDQFVGSRDVELRPGKNVYVLQEVGSLEGFRTYSATIEALADTLRENNEAHGYTRVFGKPRILLVGPDGDTELIARAIAQENWEVERSMSLPARRVDAEDYDALVMANVPSENFSNGQVALVRDYVRDLSGGFLMVGGENSFGLGGYGGTPIEEALPVSLELKNKRYFPSLALAIVVDKSGSMAEQVDAIGTSKMELANEAAVQSLSLLTDSDEAMVVAFDGSPKIVWDMAPVGGNRNRVSADVLSIRPGGGTDVFTGMRAALDRLLATRAQLKHMIVLSDGQTHAANFPALCAEASAGGVTISTVAIGRGADAQLMQTIASLGGGRFYETDDPFRIPRIFAKETYIAQRAYIIEEPFTPSLFQENQIIKGLRDFPAVRGYVVTEAKDRAEMVLLSHKGDPLLGSWRFGLGKSIAFTSDAKSRWLAEWVGWRGFDQFWIQAVRWVLRSQERSQLRPSLAIERGKGKIVVDAVSDDDRFINFLELQTRVTMPDRSGRESGFDVPLRQTGPGRYEGEFDARDPGTYLIRVHGAEEQGIAAATTGSVISYAPEYRDLQSNSLLLQQIAATTGGRYAPPLTELFTRDRRTARSRTDMWWWLLMLAVVLFPADVAARRVFLDEEQVAALRAFGRRFVPRLPRRADAAGGPLDTIEALRRTRGRGGRRAVPAPPTADAVAPADAAAADADGAAAAPPEPPLPQAAPGAALAAALQAAAAARPPHAAAADAAPPSPADAAGTLGRLRQAAAPKPAAPRPASPERPLILPARPSAPAPAPPASAAGADDADDGTSPTERLLRARDRARKKP